MKRAALYARVSTARQEQEETIDSQIAEVKSRIIADGALLTSEFTYIDEGYSGSMLERPSLDAMLEAAKNQAFDVLYIYDLGRLSRQLSHLLIVTEHLEKYGREVVSLHERITGTPEDKFLLHIMGSMHEYERAKIAERFRRGKMYKAKSGKIVGYNAPYGYVYNKDNGLFEINPHEAIVVKNIFDWVVEEGLSSYAIIERLHDEGFQPPKKMSDYWSRGPISRILKNETYFGKHHFNKSESILPRTRIKDATRYRKIQKTGRRSRPREEWISFNVPAIISEELFNKAQIQLLRNSKFNAKNRKHEYLLTSLIKCTCGAGRNGDGPEGKKYYRCTARHRFQPTENKCHVGGLNVQVTDSIVWNEISRLLSSPEVIREHAHRWLEQQSKRETITDSSLYKNELQELKNEQKRYVDAYGKGLIDEGMFSTKMTETNKQMRSLDKQMTNSSANRGIVGKIDIEELISKASQKIGKLDFEQKKFIIERVIDKIVASPKEITIWGYIPTPSLVPAYAKVNHVSQHRNRWTAKRREIDVI